MARKVRFSAFDRLSDEAKAVVYEGLENDWTQQKIQAQILVRTGEKISNGALGRFVQNWRRAREQEKKVQLAADKALKAAKGNAEDADELASNLIMLGMMAQLDEAGEIPVTKLITEQRRYAMLRVHQQKLELEKQRIENLERQLELSEKKLAAEMERREKLKAEAERAVKVAEKTKTLPPEVMQEIRSIYGLASEGAA